MAGFGYRYGHRNHADGSIWPVFVVFGIIILVYIIDQLYQKWRRNKIREYCFQNGLSFCDNPVDSTSLTSSVAFKESCYDVMQKGVETGVRAMMQGMMGEIEFRSADYYYVEIVHTSKGRRRHYHYYTLTELYKPYANLGYFYAREENLFDGVGVAMGNQDIDFSSDKNFSNKFLLQGNEADVRQLFTQRARNAFVSHHIGGCCYEGTNDCLLVYCKGYKTIGDRLKMLEHGYHIMQGLAPNNRTANFIPEMPPLEQEPQNNAYGQQYDQQQYGQSYGQQSYGQQYGQSYDQQQYGQTYGQKPQKKVRSWKDACDPFNDFK